MIVSFGRPESLRKSLRALGNAHQVLVVDNASPDGLVGFDEEFPEVRFIRLPKNFGLTKALNIGTRAADGEYVLFLHDDTRIEGDAVIRLADFLEARQDAGAVCPLLRTETGAAAPQVRALPTPSAADPPLRPAEGSGEIVTECVLGAAILFRSFFLRALRHIDERYGNYGSDIEACAQIKRASRKLIVLESVEAVHGGLESPMKASALEADRAAGTAAFIGKHHGFVTGILYRLRAGLVGLFTFRFSVVAGALGGTKIDGTH